MKKIENKQCSKCKTVKPLRNFYRDPKAKDRLFPYCKSCQVIMFKKWRKDNPDKLAIYKKEWRSKHREYYRIYMKSYMTGVWLKRPRNRINASMGRGIWESIKSVKSGRKWESLAGYTLKDLMEHLEKQFDSNMSWDNYGSYWEIDHIKPRSLFNYILPEETEFKVCWGLDNLQPLEKRSNRIKYNSY